MTRIHSLLVAVGIALCFGGAAAADEPEPDGSPAESAAGATVVTPDPALTTLPAPPPAPLVSAPASGVPAAAGDDADAETKMLRPDPRFGDPGQVALSGALSASIGHLGYDSGSSSSTSISVAPAFDYFASRDFSQGVSALFRYADSTSGLGVKGESKTVGVTARVGRNFLIGRRFSFWPRLGFEAWRTWLHFEAPSAGFVATIGGSNFSLGTSSDFTEQGLTIGLAAPVLLHLTRHFFVGFGPDVYADVFHSVDGVSNRRRFLGASSVVGGWF